MENKESVLLYEYSQGKITKQEFYDFFPVNVKVDFEYTRKKVTAAIQKGDGEEIEAVMALIWLSENSVQFVDVLNELLVTSGHWSHQYIAKVLQDEIKSPSSIPFVGRVLESNFDFLEYTASESGVIAKWFSWLLYEIGTAEAIDLMREYANSADEGIRNEMRYRLAKVKPD